LGVANAPSGLTEGIGFDVDHRHTVTLLGKLFDDGQPNAAGGPGDHGHRLLSEVF
jgi:hypothetical protein